MVGGVVFASEDFNKSSKPLCATALDDDATKARTTAVIALVASPFQSPSAIAQGGLVSTIVRTIIATTPAAARISPTGDFGNQPLK